MICVEQSRLGPDFGNCFEAAISSLLECPIDDVPRWQGVPDAPWEEYEPLLNAWLAERGLIVWVVSVIPEPLPLSVVGESLPPVPFVAGVRTTASYNHALVCDRSRVLWDPGRGPVSSQGDGALRWVALCLVILSLLVPSVADAYPKWWRAQAACIHAHEGGWHERTTWYGAPSRQHGGFQISLSTWAAFAPRSWPSDPAAASPAQQRFVAWLIYVANGRRWGYGRIGAQWTQTAAECGLR